MNEASKFYRKKWRPTLSMIVVAMLMFVLALPIGGIWLFKFYDNILVRETESELIMQGAFITAIVRQELEARNVTAENFIKTAPAKNHKGPDLQLPQLDLPTATILPRRLVAHDTPLTATELMVSIGEKVLPVLKDAQETTLAGYRITDANGIVVAGRSEMGQALAHIFEVREALRGEYKSVLRERRSNSPRPPIYSISRGTNIRVFVAIPIQYQGKIAGAVYLSRTPSHFLREMYGQIWQILAAVFFILIVTFAIGYLFVRTIKGPIDALNARIQRIAKGDREAIAPLQRHGTREIASLSHGLLSMSEKLQDRNDYIRTFANHVSHELKSPLTSINGAAELLRDSTADMASEKRTQFLNNIMQDTDRLSTLLDRLRELAASEQDAIIGKSNLRACIEQTSLKHQELEIIHDSAANLDVTVSAETLEIILANLFENSNHHGATRIEISVRSVTENAIISVIDNGTGISHANREKVLDLFFTTRRESGGTGMGLSIIRTILSTHGGSIQVLDIDDGAGFEITIPLSN